MAQARLEGEKDEEMFITPDMQNIKDRVQEARKIHDHILDHRGVVSGTHRCHRLPFNEKLRKKKKFREARQANKTSTERPARALHLVPLYSESAKEIGLRDNFEHICKGARLRTADMDSDLRCRLLHHHNPFSKLGPFMVEEASLQPYIIIAKQLMTDTEMRHFKDTAVTELERSGHAGKEGSTTSMRRTSKQAWLDHRNFNYSVSDLSAILKTTEAETNKTLRENMGWASVMVRPDTLVSSDKVLERVSNRMERATKTNLLSPIGAEQFQVCSLSYSSIYHIHIITNTTMQVANYGLGGQYSQHTDPHGYWDGRTSDPGYAQTGDRLLTIMVYLASVEAGGATSFPVTGNRIAAKSGDAAIWVRGLHCTVLLLFGLQQKL